MALTKGMLALVEDMLAIVKGLLALSEVLTGVMTVAIRVLRDRGGMLVLELLSRELSSCEEHV